jgi:hypothetical protein
MPSVTPRQHAFFEWVFHAPGAAKKAGVPRSLAKEFLDADSRKGTKSTSFKTANVKKGKIRTGSSKNIAEGTA